MWGRFAQNPHIPLHFEKGPNPITWESCYETLNANNAQILLQWIAPIGKVKKRKRKEKGGGRVESGNHYMHTSHPSNIKINPTPHRFVAYSSQMTLFTLDEWEVLSYMVIPSLQGTGGREGGERNHCIWAYLSCVQHNKKKTQPHIGLLPIHLKWLPVLDWFRIFKTNSRVESTKQK